MVNQSKPTVAIFGGSFDPPHLGHQHIVETAIQRLDIDSLLLVPAYLSPFKTSSLASAKKRLEWCHTLFDNSPKVIVKAYEIQEGKSTTTSQTIKHFNIENYVKYLIIGSDNLEKLSQWHQFDWLNSHIIWVIVTREGHPIKTDFLNAWRVLYVDTAISSSQIRKIGLLDYVDTKIKKSVHHVLQGQNK